MVTDANLSVCLLSPFWLNTLCRYDKRTHRLWIFSIHHAPSVSLETYQICSFIISNSKDQPLDGHNFDLWEPLFEIEEVLTKS